MSGQMISRKQHIVDAFMKRVGPFKKHDPINVDLRAYSKYIRENNIPTEKITPEIMNKFVVRQKTKRKGPLKCCFVRMLGI